MLGTRSFMAKGEEIQRKWYIIDAEGKPLGRLAVQIARILSGKNKPTYTPHVDTGDFVIVVNAEKVGLTGKKLKNEKFTHHTGYMGGLRTLTYEQVLQRRPEYLIEKVVKGMLPKTILGRQMFRKLKVYAGPNHPHSAQQPEEIK